MPKQFERGYVKIDLDAVEHNIEAMRTRINDGSKMILVVKTDAYGHGAVPIALLAEPKPFVWGFAVATFEEAKHLRENGIRKPILILGYTFPYCYEEMIAMDIRPAVFRMDTLQQLSEAAVKTGNVARIHIKVDTGMSRIGVYPDEEGLALIREAERLPGIETEGVFTHFARADEADKQCTLDQYETFSRFVADAESMIGHPFALRHCSNSAAIVESSLAGMHMDCVRAGITLYGLWPSQEVDHKAIDLKPVLSLLSHLVYVKDGRIGSGVSYGSTYQVTHRMKIATVPLGYGDGYPRSLSNCGYVLIRGRKAPVLGRVCMDQFMVDVTDIPGVCCGDEVTLIGTDGAERISMEELGDLSGRFNYEFACDLGKRLPRVFYYHGKPVASTDQFCTRVQKLL